jgi:hypothetical protein
MDERLHGLIGMGARFRAVFPQDRFEEPLLGQRLLRVSRQGAFQNLM